MISNPIGKLGYILYNWKEKKEFFIYVTYVCQSSVFETPSSYARSTLAEYVRHR